jgi:amino acid adenylation domain-containing protein
MDSTFSGPQSEQTAGTEASVFPASYAQQRLWFMDQLMPGSVVYNISGAILIHGPLNVTALERSMQEVVNRHESLRTRFTTMEGEPVQLIEDQIVLPVALEDLNELPEPQRSVEARRVVREEVQKSFDLKRGPLLRAKVLRLQAQEHILVLTMHHIIADGWSLGIVVREISMLYASFDAGTPSLLPELPIQYADYSMWQREWLAGGVMERQLEYWKKQLAGVAPLELPTDHSRPFSQSYKGKTIYFQIAPSLTQELRELSQRESVSLYMTLLAAFQILLYRYTGQRDITVGSPIAGRIKRETEELVGLFINTLVLRGDLSGKPAFNEYLRRVRNIALEAYAHQEVPFEKVVETLASERDLSRTPLFQVLLTLQAAPQSEARLGVAKLENYLVDTATAKFEITLVMSESASEINCVWDYSTDLFDESTMQRMIAHYQTLLASIVANPKQSIAHLSMLTHAEEDQILAWTRPQFQTVEHTVPELFTRQATRTPQNIAVTFEGSSLTYEELNARANRLARYLIKLGIGAEVRVGICVDRSLDTLVGLLGIIKAGGTYLPLDPNYPPERLGFMLEDSRAPVLLIQGKLKAKLPAAYGRVVLIDEDWHLIEQESSENPAVKVNTGNACHVIYTSGSTGRPKGVLTTHENVVRLMNQTWPWFGFNDGDVWTFFHSYAFDFSVWEIWGALLYGGRVVVVPHMVSRTPSEFLALLTREHVTVLNQTPSAFKQLMQAREATSEKRPLSLRVVLFGGEALEFQSLRNWLEREPELRFVNMYGPTETTVHSTYHQVTAEEIRDGETRSKIGKAIPDLSIHLLDEEMQLVPNGVKGEIYIGGRGLARGYLDRPDLTAQRFLPDPYSTVPGGRLYRTGDQGSRRNDGCVEYFGRLDSQVKIRGFRIELGEIESVLSECPGVRQSAVTVREDVPGDKKLVAYLVAGEEVNIGEIRDRLKERLPDYMVPSAFVMLEAMPLTPNRKIDRQALPAPSASQGQDDANYVAPRNPTEEALAVIWSEVLGLPCVSVEDNFFSLGGHSLLATQIVYRTRETFHVDLPLRSLFESPTIANAARLIEKLQKESSSDSSSGPAIVRRERRRTGVAANEK